MDSEAGALCRYLHDRVKGIQVGGGGPDSDLDTGALRPADIGTMASGKSREEPVRLRCQIEVQRTTRLERIGNAKAVHLQPRVQLIRFGIAFQHVGLQAQESSPVAVREM